MRTATGELIAIFDADFLPPRAFLMRTVHYFADPTVRVGQTRWSYLNRHYNLLTEVEAMLLDGHFVIEHGARCGSGLFFKFYGTAAILRGPMTANPGRRPHQPHAVDRRVVLVDLRVLSDGAAAALSEELEAGAGADAGPDGGGRRADGHQHQSRDRGAAGDSEQLRADSEVRRRRSQGEDRERAIPAPQRLAALRRAGHRQLIRLPWCV